VIGPWAIRNYSIYHQFISVTTMDGHTLWLGNHPLASGGAFAKDQPGVPAFDAAPVDFQEKVLKGNELEQRQLFSEEAKVFMTHHPFETLKLFSKKFFIFWWFAPNSGYLYPASYLLIYKIVYFLILSLAILGLGALFEKQPLRVRCERGAVAIFIFSVAFVQAIFYVEVRHRWGIEPLMLIFTAGGMLKLWTLLKKS